MYDCSQTTVYKLYKEKQVCKGAGGDSLTVTIQKISFERKWEKLVLTISNQYQALQNLAEEMS